MNGFYLETRQSAAEAVKKGLSHEGSERNEALPSSAIKEEPNADEHLISVTLKMRGLLIAEHLHCQLTAQRKAVPVRARV